MGLGRSRGLRLGPRLRLHLSPPLALSQGDLPHLCPLGDAPARPLPEERHGRRGHVRRHSQPRVPLARRPTLDGRFGARVRPLRLFLGLRGRRLPRLLQSLQPEGEGSFIRNT